MRLTKKRSEIRYGSWWKRGRFADLSAGCTIAFSMRARLSSSSSLCSFLHQFPITALCPHHMSFTSNYRKLRVSPNARIKARGGRAISVPRSDADKSQDKKQAKDGGAQKVGLLKRVRMLNTSEYDSGLEPPKKFKK